MMIDSTGNYAMPNPTINPVMKWMGEQFAKNLLSKNRYHTLAGNFRNGVLYGKGSLTGFFAEGQIRGQWNITKSNINVGIYGKFSLFNAAGEIGIGNNDFGLALKGVVDVGTVTGFAGLIINPAKNDYFFGVEGRAAVLTAREGVQLTLWGIPIEVGGQVEALAISGKLGIGIRDGKFYFSAGTAVLFGGSFYIRIKLW